MKKEKKNNNYFIIYISFIIQSKLYTLQYFRNYLIYRKINIKISIRNLLTYKKEK